MKKLDPEFIGVFEEMLTEMEDERETSYEVGEKLLKEQMDEESDVEALRYGVDFSFDMIRIGFETIKRWEAIRHYFDGDIQAKIDAIYDTFSTDDEIEEKE